MNIIHRRPELVVPFESDTGVAGYFKLTAIRPDGRRRPLTGWVKNMILDSGLDNLGQSSDNEFVGPWWQQYCHVGEGSTAVTAGQTTLDDHLVSVAILFESDTGGTQTAVLPYYKWTRYHYRFGIGVAEGNLTEVGIGPNATNTDLTTRSLIVDTEGDPVTITVLSDEILDVTYEIRAYTPDLDTHQLVIVIDSINYDTLRKACEVDKTQIFGKYSWGVGPTLGYQGYTPTWPNIGATVFDEPATTMNSFGAVKDAYVAGTYYRTSEGSYDIDENHYGARGVTAIKFTGTCNIWQISFASQSNPGYGIPHDNTNELIVTYKYSWSRYVAP